MVGIREPIYPIRRAVREPASKRLIAREQATEVHHLVMNELLNLLPIRHEQRNASESKSFEAAEECRKPVTKENIRVVGIR